MRWAHGCYGTLIGVIGSRLISVGSDDLEWRQSFQADIRNYARTVWPNTTKFGRVTHGAVAYF